MKLESDGLNIISARLIFKRKSHYELGTPLSRQLGQLIETLDDHPDVQEVFY